MADEVWSTWDFKKGKKNIEKIYESKTAELTPERDFDKLLNIEIEKQMYIGCEDEKIGYHQAGSSFFLLDKVSSEKKVQRSYCQMCLTKFLE